MSFIKKTLASFGIGSARVDTILKHEALVPGQMLHVDVHVYGGASTQTIDNIEMKLCCQYVAEVKNREDRRQQGAFIKETYVLASWALPYAFEINPGQDKVFPVDLNVPWNTPSTVGDSKVWLETGLDIAHSLDPTDKDMLTVRPDPLLDGVFTALEDAGLRIRQVECEEATGFELPFVQEFEFVPVEGDFLGRWRHLEMIAYRNQSQLQLWFEVDREKSGDQGLMASLVGLGKLKRKMTLDASHDPVLAGAEVLAYLDETTG
ncbi:MAG: sporulation protein [Vibrio sp.]